VIDTATVTSDPAGGTTPTGNVTFQVKGPGDANFANFGSNPVTLNASGIAASSAYTPTVAGTYYFRAIYNGDGKYNVSQSADTAEPLTVTGGGCTLTWGYWKTHSYHGPAAHPDDTWNLIQPNGVDSPFFSSGQTYYQVLQTEPKGGNAYYILAHQYIAAELNMLNDASSTAEVDAAMAWAEDFFNTYGPSDTFSKALRASIVNNAGTLGSYNEGLIGPGHCSE
jgi:hypothetical protein